MGGGTEAGVLSPQWGNCLSQKKKHLRLKVKQLISGSLNGIENQTDLARAVCTLDRDAGPLEHAVVGSCSIGIMEQFQDEGCC